MLQQGLSNEQSSLNHHPDEERSEDQGVGRVEGQEEHGHIGQADSAANQQVDQKVCDAPPFGSIVGVSV